jgi:cytosine/adenosine deaminase-related metal-dependent hydrolase
VLWREGITVALGTDGAASNDNQDMLAAMKTAALLHKVHALRADAITAREVVRMATIDGARSLGLESSIGSLEAGKRADVVLLDGNTPELATIHDPWQMVVYSATGRCVSWLWVDGRERVRGGQLVDVDLPALAREARAQARDLAIRACLESESAYALGSGTVVKVAPEPELE